MLRKEFKKQGNILFRHRSYFPFVVLLIGFAVFVRKTIHLSEIGEFYPEQNLMILSLLVTLAGLLIRILTVGFTPANTSGRNSKMQIAEDINTTGIYSTVRHPLYLGNFFMWLGLALLTSDIWFIAAFVLFYFIYYERIMFAEEQFMYKQFKNDYKKWAKQTPAIIPSFKNYKKTKLPFSWKKILKQEKNGFAAIFILFYLFDFSAHIIYENRFVVVFNFWFFAALLATAGYFILKYMKWNTQLLDEPGR